MKKKKASIVGLTTVASMSLLFAGCSSSTSSTSSTSAPSNAPSQGASGGQATVIKIGYIAAEKSPVDQAAHQWADLVSKDTNGKVKIEIYPNSQLGGEQQMIESMKVGALDAVLTGDAAFSMYTPDYAGMSTPYLFRDQAQLFKVLNGPIGQNIKQEFQKTTNSQVLDWWERGPRELTANKEIKSPDDLKGVKIRVPEMPLVVDSWKALGANPTPMSFDQLFNAMQQHVIDAQENPLDLIYTSKFNEVQKYVMMTDHMIVPWIFLMNNAKLNSFPPDVQKMIKDDAVKAGQFEKDVSDKSIEDYKQKLTASGMKVVDVDKSLFSKKLEAAKVTDKYSDKWAPNFLQQVRDTK